MWISLGKGKLLSVTYFTLHKFRNIDEMFLIKTFKDMALYRKTTYRISLQESVLTCVATLQLRPLKQIKHTYLFSMAGRTSVKFNLTCLTRHTNMKPLFNMQAPCPHQKAKKICMNLSTLIKQLTVVYVMSM